MKSTKAFGIGFQKTGTTTLGVILERLGYRTASFQQFRHLSGRQDLGLEEVEAHALEVMRDHDAAKDSPWPILYRSLDRAFPGSKFIHIEREPQAWIRSAVNDFGDNPNAIRKLIYGVPYPAGNEAVWVERYERHNREVKEYFADRPGDFLSLRLEDGVTFEKICPFLGEPLVARGAPVANTRFRKRLKTLWWRLTK